MSNNSKQTKQQKQPKVVLFTSPSCHWCTTAKKYLKQHNIKFNTIDITKDAQAEFDCHRHGCRGVPVVLIGTKWICGFDQSKISKLLKIK